MWRSLLLGGVTVAFVAAGAVTGGATYNALHSVGTNSSAAKTPAAAVGWCCGSAGDRCYRRETALLCLRTDAGLAFTVNEQDCTTVCSTLYR